MSLEAFKKSDVSTIKKFGIWVTAACILSYVVMVLGSLVRATESGLACPDWPYCFGQLVPYFDYQIFLEWFHRLLAGSLVLVFGYVLVQLFREKVLRRAFSIPMIVCLILLANQVILGGLTVLKLLDPKIVSFHLINAVLFLTVFIWVALKARFIGNNQTLSFQQAPAPKFVRISFYAMSVIVFAQLFLGGMVSTNNVGLICPDFPTCMGHWLPPSMSFLVGLQVFHRFAAYFIMILSIVLFFMIRKHKLSALPKFTLILAPTLIALQILLGVANVVYQLPPALSVAHLANGLIIYILFTVSSMNLYLASQSARATQGYSVIYEKQVTAKTVVQES